MDWREEYKRKLTSAEDAMKAIGPGQRVVIPIAGPRVLTEALYRRGHELGGYSCVYLRRQPTPAGCSRGWSNCLRWRSRPSSATSPAQPTMSV
jgi:hypothetical protein